VTKVLLVYLVFKEKKGFRDHPDQLEKKAHLVLLVTKVLWAHLVLMATKD
jgi:hypothetical protein